MVTSIESLILFHKFTRRIGSVSGLDFVNKFKIRRMLAVTLFDALIYMFVNVNSAWQQRNNTDNMIYCVLTAGFGISGLTMIFEFIRHNQITMDLYRKALEFHVVRKDVKIFQRTLNKFNRSLSILKTILSFQITFSGILLSLYPLPASFYYKKLILVYGFYLPFLDHTEPLGFFANLVYQLVQTIIVTVGFTYFANVYISFILQVVVQYEALVDMLNQLKMIGAQNFSHRLDELIRQKLKLIIQEYQTQLKYISDLETLINKILLVQIIFTAQGVLFTLYILIDHFWVAGFPLLVFSMLSLFVACVSGTIMENSADTMMRAVYDTNWYYFSINDQKSLLLLLAVSQQPHNLTFGGGAYLNMNTFLDFSKRIYSLYMMMRKVK